MYVMGSDISTISGRVGMAFLFALETGMRAAEIANLCPWNVSVEKSTLQVVAGKTVAATREVPLSDKALKIIAGMRAESGPVFGLSAMQISSNFILAKKSAGIDGFHFHDSRANAVTMMAKKIGILDLAKAIGHKDLAKLQVYYRESMSDIAKKLNPETI